MAKKMKRPPAEAIRASLREALDYAAGKRTEGVIHKVPPQRTHRQRLNRRGIVRVEVHVRKEDAALVHGLAEALSDPARETEARALLREHFGGRKTTGLKALLVAAPLEEIDLTRDRDFGRDVVQ